METFLLINALAFVAITIYGIYLFVKVVATRVAYIRLGRKSEFDRDFKERFRRIGKIVFGQSKLLKDKKSGIIHVMMFYGFILVQFGAIDMFIKGLSPDNHLPLGIFYPGFVFFQELVTLMILVAVAWAFYRRYMEKLVRLKRGFKAGLVLIFIGTLMISVLFGNGMALLWHGHDPTWTEPIASSIALVFGWITPTVAMVLFYIAWWVHTITILTFLVYVPQSKHAHLLAAPVNVFLSKRVPGKLKKLDFDMDEEADEEEISFGVGKVEDFEQHQMIDFYACVECGRCTDVCPAAGSGKMLSPMDIMIKVRDHLTEKGAAITGKSPWVPAYAFSNTQGNSASADNEAAATVQSASLIGDVITEEELSGCTTCRNCEDACPVNNEHVGTIIDMRRYLVMTEGKMDQDVQRAVMNIERQGNPWGLSKKDRIKWREQDEAVYIPTVKELKKEDKEFEYLFWVSSMGAYDSRSQKIAIAFAKLMNQAGISFAILGNKEANSGDTARRIGNEFLFQEIAEKNIKEFTKNNVQKIVTIDPHAYNIFKNEYPDFGFEAEVYHHTQLLYDLVLNGKLEPQREINQRLTYHDSCYLGRYNGVYDPPREILRSIPGLELVEMNRSKENGMCCGAGGGLMWSEETTGNRINVARTEQAMAVQPNMISSACPYCLTMISDGTKAKEVEEDISTMDVAEILALSVFREEEVKSA
ncbi:MAG: (Fe-S)-binding protein [Bacillota bacterium]|uniref:4Fe-4S dicluster domain-containing protein n=1 Tax=Virgibacillus salarius TaxID=447199 RepID=A0A941DTT9_9BACI|nr:MULTISPECIES: (Fe-S)-binding protein [Bacillaceae]NAZ08319.1 4Fe-4S dicluster domain-containing protein [Agaribacter marinus]MBR7795606.1 4Fe-4S dicluster domain-containing protein [Virgibacillus salarius]MCC2252567.1 4Fe-4S dicluster domain-containing protein [Virgibacillus sp. AGTR]MDY7046594.1 heterodisulfide reductase-related iron-sulfur binding cluster [Virgibacillus sp. M23]QRZ18562.1 4Fe-4S dicluster domain-containing protein [Virgibacillus sp. AGTR]